MKTLKTIQALAKTGRILSTIVFVFSLIGAIFCVVGIFTFALIPEGFKIGEMTIRALIEDKTGVGAGTIYASMAAGIVTCAGEAVLSKLAERYFANELKAGTPFTASGTSELMRLGICAVCIPVGTAIMAEIIRAVMKLFFANVGELVNTAPATIGLGVMFIVTSLICRYGTEIAAGGTSDRPAE